MTRNLVLLAFASASLQAADWPTWGGNARRTFSTREALPRELHLQWCRKELKPRPAWPASQAKLRFDDAPYPIVADGLVLLTSTVSNDVTAVDLVSGEMVWCFPTNGPVRFAPAVAGGVVYVGSDDGFLYCLEARTGAERWRFRGGPDGRMVLGNDRLISMWPVRGAPVVSSGVVYFAAGIWPFMGVFIHALDSATGKPVWCNSATGSQYILQQHSSPAFSGIAPQGYLTVVGERLLLPGGRSVPAVFDVHTGKQLYFHLDSRQFGKDAGGYGIRIAGDLFVNGNAAYRILDGTGLFAVPGQITDESMLLGLAKEKLVATSTTPKIVEVKGRKEPKGPPIKKTVPDVLWSRELREPLKRLFFKADSVLAGTDTQGRLVLMDVASTDVVWRRDLPAAAVDAVAAAGRLIVSLASGDVLCFAGADRGGPAIHALAEIAPPPSGDAGDVGYALFIDPDSPDRPLATASGTRLDVIVVESDIGRCHALRTAVRAAGLGSRLHVIHGALPGLGLPAYFATSVVVGSRFVDGRQEGVSPMDVVNALHPYRGKAEFPATATAWLRGGQYVNETIEERDGKTFVARGKGLRGSGVWTHQNADSANTLMSTDSLVRLPLGLLWFGGPSNDDVLPRHGHGPTPQVYGGRLFIEGEHMLRAVDVYTGRLLWQREIPDVGKYHRFTAHMPGANEIGGNFVVCPESVYVVRPDVCLRLDPATGTDIGRFNLPEKAKWGTIYVHGDCLVATGHPLYVPAESEQTAKASANPIPRNAEWHYLLGRDPPADWMKHAAKPKGWQRGKAAFGYGARNIETELAGMQGQWTRVYVRSAFTVELETVAKLNLLIRYDDAFIAYLNGREVLRKGVEAGAGADARGIVPHEAAGVETFELPVEALRDGANWLCIEGHNRSLESSDFVLDPALAAIDVGSPGTTLRKVAWAAVKKVRDNDDYSSASRRLYVLDRKSGDVLWSRRAEYGFRHNAVAVADDKVFCMDAMSPDKRRYLTRRGAALEGTPHLYALNLRTGDVVWQEDKEVFGTWLSYSSEHGVLFQGGSRNRDRARDEVGQGMATFDGATGALRWRSEAQYGGPCMLRHDWLIAQGQAFDMMTGDPITVNSPLTGNPVPWTFRRNYGCNTAICSENLVTFRSAAAGYFDLAGGGGTGNFGGFKSGCTSNLIVADGVLNAPDYTRTCTCSYQQQASLALVHMPDVETWTSNTGAVEGRIERLGLNFGAPGDRLAEDGVLWLDWPSVGGWSPDVAVSAEPESPEPVIVHSSLLAGGHPLKWVAASGLRGVARIDVDLQGSGVYRGLLVFRRQPGVSLNVSINGRTQAGVSLDGTAENDVVVVTLPDTPVDGEFVLRLTPRTGVPVISGLRLETTR